jgi:hypothetical protein
LEKHKERRLLGRPQSSWEDNMTVDHKYMGWEGEEKIDLSRGSDWSQDSVQTVMGLLFPKPRKERLPPAVDG